MVDGLEPFRERRTGGDFAHAGGTLSSNGIALATHTHTGVQPGGGNTGGPQ